MNAVSSTFPLRAFLRRYRDAIYDKDVEAFASLFSDSARIFDAQMVWERRGADGARESARALLARAASGERLVLSFSFLDLREYDGAASVSALVRHTLVTGDSEEHFTPTEHQRRRVTWLFERIGEEWLIVHEHASVPVDATSGEAMLKITEESGEPLASAWTVRAEQAGDEADIHGINAAAFPTEEEADLVNALRKNPEAWMPGLSMLSCDGDRPVGYALLTRCYVGETPALALAPCAVLPEYQFTGAGSAAITAVLNAARAQGEKYVVVLGHHEYYPRFGFKRAATFGVGLSIDVPEESLMVLNLEEDSVATFPAGTVRYAAPFGI
ncbi:putative N-acetyltransferase YhbS/ketosteroid isomerase-like protein [Neomicrococcus aestuarii]|uniref:Putative N-acetyltransferase YhbS/ketosteroid isomerase-like protein n=1 Tax=Neomicrococcus aestuarii TaxID=556325 RepID=A0A7W8TTQ6_9MICC|nr:putative N-acetyltransferase YhbS/ketosteroid isomerase-like protein [Neomicrococcus aestuarii]